MPHLVEGHHGGPTSLDVFRRDLIDAHHALVRAASMWVAHGLEDESWGRAAKRKPVIIPPVPPLMVGGEQPFGEVTNQLATIERLIEALCWAALHGVTHVHGCNPTTGGIGHDLVVGSSDSPMMTFEVCDVVGSGNGNQKMVKDLRTLLACKMASCSCCSTRKLMAVSCESGRWLERFAGRAGVVDGVGPVELSVLEHSAGLSSWIIEVAVKQTGLA